MSSSGAEMFTCDPHGWDAWSDYRRDLYESRADAAEGADDRSGLRGDSDGVWRWEFSVLSQTGELMRTIRVNAGTVEDAAVLARQRIDADRVLGEARRIRRATES